MLLIRSNILTQIMISMFIVSEPLYAITLPSRLPSLQRAGESMDPGLEAWFKSNIELMPVSEMNAPQIMIWIADKDPVTRALILIDSAKNKRPAGAVNETGAGIEALATAKREKDAALQETLTDVPGIIDAELKKPLLERNPMLADLYLAWKSMVGSSVSKNSLDKEVFADESKVSCASKSQAIKAVTREKLSQMSSNEIIGVINSAELYKSLSYRRRYLEAVAQSVPEKRREDIVGPLRAYAKDLPALVHRFTWIQGDDSLEGQENNVFIDVSRQVRKKKCEHGEKIFKARLEQNIPQSTLQKAVDIGSEVERCYRAERRSAAQAFWTRMAPVMESRYGKEGALWVQIRFGYIKWVASEYSDATKIYENVVAEAKAAGTFPNVVAKSTYVLAKIAEDSGDLETASKYYEEYIVQFSDKEDFEFALNSLIVNLAIKKQWHEMIPPLEKFLAQQSLVHIDRRPVGAMAFSLFWLGRAHLQLGRAELAREMWRRLAAEYYSTFYGAMGHYLLEQSSGRNYAIEPSRVSGFDFDSFAKKMPESNRLASRRTSAFLKAGLPEKARCEVEEIVAAGPTDYDSLLVRTLLLHASGAWLEAIKIFDAIPRSVRSGLPVGFERVLFPRKYAEIVKAKTAKLGLDPDFVFALMRQESVFSKDAMSPVGATGLMQLMPATARLEMGKLSSQYIDPSERALLHEAMNRADSLRDPEINLTLGVHHLWRLMKTYKSPVFALTAYNASPAATQKWQRTLATDDWLTFIERIPYKETRAYVKLILRNYFYYKRWYSMPDGKSQIHIDSVVDDLVALVKKPPKEEREYESK